MRGNHQAGTKLTQGSRDCAFGQRLVGATGEQRRDDQEGEHYPLHVPGLLGLVD